MKDLSARSHPEKVEKDQVSGNTDINASPHGSLSLKSRPINLGSMRIQRKKSLISSKDTTSSLRSPTLSPAFNSFNISSDTSNASSTMHPELTTSKFTNGHGDTADSKPYNPIENKLAAMAISKSDLQNGRPLKSEVTSSVNFGSTPHNGMGSWWNANASDASSAGFPLESLNSKHTNSFQSPPSAFKSSQSISSRPPDFQNPSTLSSRLPAPSPSSDTKSGIIQPYPLDFPPEKAEFSRADCADNEEDEEQSPVEIVRIIVSNNDEVGLPVFTFRFWIILTIFTILVSAVNQYYILRDVAFILNGLPFQLISYPIGKFMEKVLPNWSIRLPLFGKLSLNPGPFNMKEHALIVIGVNAALYPISSAVPDTLNFIFNIDVGAAGWLFTVIGTQLIGPSLAGFCIFLVVEPAFMIWPDALSNVSFFYALHEPMKGFCFRFSRIQYVWAIISIAMLYQILPSFIMPLLSSLPILCWFAKTNFTINTLGSFYHGVGLFSFTLDWGILTNSYPFIAPWWAQLNFEAGYILFAWVLMPILYFTNWSDSLKYPIVANNIYNQNGTPYDLSQIVNFQTVTLIPGSIEKYSQLVLPPPLLLSYAFSAITSGSVISYVLLWYGPEMYNRTLDLIGPLRNGAYREHQDVHTKLMKRYPSIPWMWYAILFAFSVISVATMLDLQAIMPWYATIFCIVFSLFFGLLVNVIAAKTVVYIDAGTFLTSLIASYILPGSATGNLAFHLVSSTITKGFSRSAQAFKLAHYVKIEPRKVFLTLVYSTVVGCLSNYLVYTLVDLGYRDEILENVNVPLGMPVHSGNGWTIGPLLDYYLTSILFGTVGSKHLLAEYPFLPWTFFIGIFIPIPFWVASKVFPRYLPPSKMILICWPVVFRGALNGIGCTVFIALALSYFTMHWLIRHRQRVWRKYVYVTSVSLDIGAAMVFLIIFLICDVILPFAQFPTWFGNMPQPNTENCPFLPPPNMSQ